MHVLMETDCFSGTPCTSTVHTCPTDERTVANKREMQKRDRENDTGRKKKSDIFLCKWLVRSSFASEIYSPVLSNVSCWEKTCCLYLSSSLSLPDVGCEGQTEEGGRGGAREKALTFMSNFKFSPILLYVRSPASPPLSLWQPGNCFGKV